MKKGRELVSLFRAKCYHFYMKLSDITDYFGFTNARAEAPVEAALPYRDIDDLGERKSLYKWETTNIPSNETFTMPKFNRSFVVIGLFVILLFLLMKEFLLIAALGAIFFLWSVLSKVSAQNVTHELTSHGVDYAGQFFKWTELSEYYFSSKNGSEMLCINTSVNLPKRLFLVLGNADKNKINEILGKYLDLLKKEPNTVFDKAYTSVLDKISLDGE